MIFSFGVDDRLRRLILDVAQRGRRIRLARRIRSEFLQRGDGALELRTLVVTQTLRGGRAHGGLLIAECRDENLRVLPQFRQAAHRFRATSHRAVGLQNRLQRLHDLVGLFGLVAEQVRHGLAISVAPVQR